MSIYGVKTYLTHAYTAEVPQRGKYKGPTDDKAIGRKLKELRLAQGMSQIELSKQLGINQSLISEYEKGTVRLHAPLLAGHAKALHASADEILGLKKAGSNGALVDRRFTRRLKQIAQLPPAQQQAVLKLLDGVLESQAAPTH
jgi:transcriptional regulator with XRE-family HTH domain